MASSGFSPLIGFGNSFRETNFFAPLLKLESSKWNLPFIAFDRQSSPGAGDSPGVTGRA